MTTTTGTTKAGWQAEVTCKRRRYITNEPAPADQNGETPAGKTIKVAHFVWRCYVEIFVPDGERIVFSVNDRDGRSVSFTDPRERSAGTAGTTGLWGTRPAQRAVKPRSLTPSAFRREIARLIGAERADEIIESVMPPDVSDEP